jgi:glycosyltransferase involved in cell wall biosynthesis
MISVVIPTYEMSNYGDKFLSTSLTQLTKQSFKNFEVVISDHSRDDSIYKLTKEFNSSLNIRYLRNLTNYGNSSANLNNGLINANGEIIKILFQDEYIINDGLKKISDFFLENKDVKWLLNGCSYGKSLNEVYGKMIPRYNENIIDGINTIGSPSVLTLKNENVELFDENLIWLMDCEYYFRLQKKFGTPNIIDDNIIFVNQHKYQLTNLLSDNQKKEEEKYIKTKYTNG